PLATRCPARLPFLPRPFPAAPPAPLAPDLPEGKAAASPRGAAEPVRGLGPASTPVARHLRRGSSEPPVLATYLLVQACQHLWPVLYDGACGGSPGLALPRAAGPRPPWCWQSQLWLAPWLPPLGVRIRCPE